MSIFNRTVKIVMLAMTLLGSIALTGCNTVAGAGKDIKAGGNAIEKAASK